MSNIHGPAWQIIYKLEKQGMSISAYAHKCLLAEEIEAAIDAAVKEERERCLRHHRSFFSGASNRTVERRIQSGEP